MFEPFTTQALQTVGCAADEAESLNHGAVGTAHVLLALASLYEDAAAVAPAILRRLGVSQDALRSRVLPALQTLPSRAAPSRSGRPPPNPGLRFALEWSVQLAAQLGHDHVGTGHVLLGLLREDQDLAGQLLGGLGVTYEKVLAQMRRRRRTTETVPPGPGWPLVPSTPGALRVPDIARQQAAHNGSRGRVGTQHYLLALTVPGSLAAKTLASFGITYEALKERCAEIGVAGSSDAPDAQRQPR